MSITDKLAELSKLSDSAPEHFQQQIDRAREFRTRFEGKIPNAQVFDRGVDRSRDLRPVQRPSLVRLARA